MEGFEQSGLLSPQERRERNRQEVIHAILEAARHIMRRDGVAGLSLNEVARLVHMQPPALYKYFPSKFAVYDALFETGVRLFQEGDRSVWNSTTPSWERLEKWFNIRLALAEEHFDLYRLVFDLPVPGFVPSEEGMQIVRQHVRDGIQAVTEMIEAGIITPGMPPDQAYDFLLVIRRGIVAEYIGKRTTFAERSKDRFRRLVPHAITFLQSAWSPTSSSDLHMLRSSSSESDLA